MIRNAAPSPKGAVEKKKISCRNDCQEVCDNVHSQHLSLCSDSVTFTCLHLGAHPDSKPGLGAATCLCLSPPGSVLELPASRLGLERCRDKYPLEDAAASVSCSTAGLFSCLQTPGLCRRQIPTCSLSCLTFLR